MVQRRADVLAGTAPADWTVQDDLLLFRGRVFVPANSPVWSTLLADAHQAGHEGTQKTLHRLRSQFHVPGMRRLVQEFVRGCAVCQRNKSEHLHPSGLLQPLTVPHQVWEDISLDFVEGFPKVHGKSVILTVVDRFSKYAHFVALGHPYTASSVARIFFDTIVMVFHLPL